MVDREALQFRIRFAFVKAVNLGRIVAGPDAGAANIESQLRGMKEIMKQARAGVCRKLVEEVARCIRECGAEAQNLLKFFLRIQRDGLGSGSTAGAFPRKRGPGRKALFIVRDPNGNWALAGGGVIERAESRKCFRRCGHGSAGDRELQKITPGTFLGHCFSRSPCEGAPIRISRVSTPA